MANEDTVILKTGEITLLQQADRGAKRRSCLILYSGTETGKRFILDAQRMTIGRLATAEIVVDTPSVSRRHAELEVSGERVVLNDLGSANGTHVNDRRIEGPIELRDGDLIRLGKVFLKYYERESLDALLHDRIYRMATVDSGTEVFNRQYLHDFLRSEFKLARATGRLLALVYFDLDHFKQVNDTYGHSAGDHVLKECAQLVKTLVRREDVFGRLGGEEFAVVLPNSRLDEATELGERIRASIEGHGFRLEVDSPSGRRGMDHSQTVSVGVAELGEAMTDPRELLDAADRALYRAKHGGRNRVSA